LAVCPLNTPPRRCSPALAPPPPPWPAQAFFQGVPPAAVAFLHIRVRRERLVEDALNALAHLEPAELKKPLRVAFLTGGVPEPAQVCASVCEWGGAGVEARAEPRLACWRLPPLPRVCCCRTITAVGLAGAG
jgi:hypothetical protein